MNSCEYVSTNWRHNERDGVSDHPPHDCLLNRLFRRRSKKISKFRVIGPCEGDSPVTGEFPSQTANNAENVSIWWRHHGMILSNSASYRSAFCRIGYVGIQFHQIAEENSVLIYQICFISTESISVVRVAN